MAKKKKAITIGEVIKNARVAKNLRADDVAELCEVSRSMVYGWEQSTFVMPKNFRRLSEALDIPIRRLERANGDAPRFQAQRQGSGMRAAPRLI